MEIYLFMCFSYFLGYYIAMFYHENITQFDIIIIFILLVFCMIEKKII